MAGLARRLDSGFRLLYDARPSGVRSRAGMRGLSVARVCELCSKKTVFGNNVSHAHNVTSRPWLPNLQRVRIRLERGGTRKIRICTRCLRSDAVRKSVS
jgi:large subunit ribosomal protein L28